MKGASRRLKGPVLAGSDGSAVELSKCTLTGREQSACGGTGRSSSLPAHRSLCPTRRRRRRLQSCRPFPPDGSLIAAVFFERKSTADTASRPSALLRSKSKSNDFVVVDFEFYLLRPELQPQRPLHCVYLADWRARCYQTNQLELFAAVDFKVVQTLSLIHSRSMWNKRVNNSPESSNQLDLALARWLRLRGEILGLPSSCLGAVFHLFGALLLLMLLVFGPFHFE
jgi:hypothetical protein